MQALQLLLNGIAQGCVYALVALGFVLIYKATETVSFVQGELMMVGGFIALISMGPLALPFWLAFVFAVAGTAAMGYGMERFLLRPLLGQRRFHTCADDARGRHGAAWPGDDDPGHRHRNPCA